MTTYAYQLVLDDTEIIMLNSALKQFIANCDEELKNGPKAPFWAQKRAAESVLARLLKNAYQTSGNNFSSEKE